MYRGLTFIFCCKRPSYEVTIDKESTQIISQSNIADFSFDVATENNFVCSTNRPDQPLLLVASNSYSATK